MFNTLAGGLIPDLSLLVILFIAWSLVWKGWALWIAARNEHKKWFIALLVINTVGILEIIYIFGFGKKELDAQTNEDIEEVVETTE